MPSHLGGAGNLEVDKLAEQGQLMHWHTGEGVYKLEFLHFKFCTKILYAICSVFFRICAGIR